MEVHERRHSNLSPTGGLISQSYWKHLCGCAGPLDLSLSGSSRVFFIYQLPPLLLFGFVTGLKLSHSVPIQNISQVGERTYKCATSDSKSIIGKKKTCQQVCCFCHLTSVSHITACLYISTYLTCRFLSYLFNIFIYSVYCTCFRQMLNLCS